MKLRSLLFALALGTLAWSQSSVPAPTDLTAETKACCHKSEAKGMKSCCPHKESGTDGESCCAGSKKSSSKNAKSCCANKDMSACMKETGAKEGCCAKGKKAQSDCCNHKCSKPEAGEAGS